ncbi:M18 family aminopeptidase [Curtobacterium sp. RRHDQ10]|uniref:M18 family aminopeptidase n=1 Tax=Curtobacterium phyllosphaerae TaxID=3413379 RepID=UPI003BF31401
MTDSTAAYVADLGAFIDGAPTPFHAVAQVAIRLREADFAELDEHAAWPNGPGAFFVVRDGAVIAWRQPEEATATTPFRIVGAHTDSPTFRIKPNPEMVGGGWSQLNVEVYGGPILSSWFDRDLAIAGRYVRADGSSGLVRTDAVCRIPNLAIHLDRGVNEGNAIDRQRHTIPIVGTDVVTDVLSRIARDAGHDAPDDPIVGWDLTLADTQAPSRIGLERDFLAAGRMDNLTSVHAGVRALVAAPADADHLPVLAAFDHEEVGSSTPSGAGGPFLEDVLRRIHDGLGATPSEAARAFRASWLLSSDAGHLVHPNHPDKHDPTNRPRPGGGPLLKINANQRYATDARGMVMWADVCARAGVPYQPYVNPNSIPGGSTIGPIAATRLGIPTVDIGVGLLSMHSVRELVHVDDVAALGAAAAAFLRG